MDNNHLKKATLVLDEEFIQSISKKEDIKGIEEEFESRGIPASGEEIIDLLKKLSHTMDTKDILPEKQLNKVYGGNVDVKATIDGVKVVVTTIAKLPDALDAVKDIYGRIKALTAKKPKREFRGSKGRIISV